MVESHLVIDLPIEAPADAAATVREIKACARTAGFTGSTSQGALLTYMSIKSRRQVVMTLDSSVMNVSGQRLTTRPTNHVSCPAQSPLATR